MKKSVRGKVLADFPELIEQWHPVKNPKTDFNKIRAGSTKKFWWRCSNGPDHEWEACVDKRTIKSTGCPCCAGRKISVTNSLVNNYPEIAKQWYPEKNDRDVSDVVAGSHARFWWKCTAGPDHKWQTSPHLRTSQSTKCPYCCNQKVSITNCLATISEKVTREWHPKKNGELTPKDIIGTSDKSHWWKCVKGRDHEWKANTYQRTINGVGCPYCAGKMVSVTNSLINVNPEVAKQWHPEKNGEFTPNNVTHGTAREVWWICDEGHEWKQKISYRTKYYDGCPECESLGHKYPELIEEWHPTKNKKIPYDYRAGSSKLVWWQCLKHSDHEWRAQISRRTRGSGCPQCANKIVSAQNNLKANFPEIASEWNYAKNEPLTPENFVKHSGTNVWWKCKKCNYGWEAPIDRRTSKGRGCPNCAGQIVNESNSLADNYPHIMERLHPTKNKLGLNPANINAGSHEKYWFLCPAGHEYEAQLDTQTRRGYGCRQCSIWGRSKIEIRLCFELMEFFTVNPDDCYIKADGSNVQVDIKLPEEKIIIEYDGVFYHKGREAQDEKKTALLRRNGWKVLRVREYGLLSVTENDLFVEPALETFLLASKVLSYLHGIWDLEIEGIASYLEKKAPVNRQQADEYIAQLLRKEGQKTLSDY